MEFFYNSLNFLTKMHMNSSSSSEGVYKEVLENILEGSLNFWTVEERIRLD